MRRSRNGIFHLHCSTPWSNTLRVCVAAMSTCVLLVASCALAYGQDRPLSTTLGSVPSGHWISIFLQGAGHFYFTYHTLTGRIFLRLSNGKVVRVTADKTPSPRCILTGDLFSATTCSMRRPIPHRAKHYGGLIPHESAAQSHSFSLVAIW